MNFKTTTSIFLMLILGLFVSSAYTSKREITYVPKVKVKNNFLPSNCSRPRANNTSISHVMLHFCSNAAVKPSNPYVLSDILGIFKTYKVSAHYLIDREGNIHHLVSEDRAAHHAGKGNLHHEPHRHNDLNGRSIGIEMMAIGTASEMRKFISANAYQKIKKEDVGFTPAQYKALKTLLEDIESRHPEVKHDREHVVGHDEYAPTRRSDPGSLFDWTKIGLSFAKS